MNEYLYLAIITLFINFIPAETDQSKKVRSIISFIPLFLYAAFRVNYGLDYDTYESMFDVIHNSSYSFDKEAHTEFGFWVLYRIMPSYRALLIFQSFVICAAYSFVFYTYIPNNLSWFAAGLLFLSGDLTIFFMLSALRNSIAVAILIFAIPTIVNRRLKSMAVLTLIAGLFHTSAFFVLPVAYFFINGVEFDKKYTVVLFVLFITLYFFSASSIATTILPFVNQYVNRYESYFLTIQESSGVHFGMFALIVLVELVMLFAVRFKEVIYEEWFRQMGLLFLMAFCLGNLNMRLSHYLIMFFIISLTQLLQASLSEKNILGFGITLCSIILIAQHFFVQFGVTGFMVYQNYHNTLLP